jgi:hypothetical protein
MPVNQVQVQVQQFFLSLRKPSFSLLSGWTLLCFSEVEAVCISDRAVLLDLGTVCPPTGFLMRSIDRSNNLQISLCLVLSMYISVVYTYTCRKNKNKNKNKILNILFILIYLSICLSIRNLPVQGMYKLALFVSLCVYVV